MSQLPTTKDELAEWLPKQVKKQNPAMTKGEIQLIVGTVMSMVHSDYSVKTFIEGWEAARTKTVDPERAARSLQDMHRNGVI